MTLHQAAKPAPQLYHPTIGRTSRGFITQDQADRYAFGWRSYRTVLASASFDVRGPECCGAFDRESHEEVSREAADAMDDMGAWALEHADECGRHL